MGRAGLLGLRFGKEYGGQGADAVTMGILVEEMARAGWQIPLGDIMGEILELNGPEALKREWLPAMAKGERMLGVANTEPSTGSDAAAITTRATHQGDKYVLKGEKRTSLASWKWERSTSWPRPTRKRDPEVSACSSLR
jgi:cyclohexanecarboxyl-CoA dehydrogenase